MNRRNMLICSLTVSALFSANAVQASNGQMIAILSPHVAVSNVQLSGVNQYGQPTVWTSRSETTLVLPRSWWWKGNVSIKFTARQAPVECQIRGLGTGVFLVLVEYTPEKGCRGDAQNKLLPEWQKGIDKQVSKVWFATPGRVAAQLEREWQKLENSQDAYLAFRRLILGY